MNNINFKKGAVLGMLIALVLAFGMQGVADAQMTATKVSGDHQDKVYTEAFTFSFRISGVNETEADDSITITVSTGSLRVGSELATGTTFTLADDYASPNVAGDNRGRLRNTTFSVTCSPGAVGSFTVTVADVDASPDFTAIIFTGYGIRRPTEIDAQAFAASSGTTNPKAGIGFNSPQGEYGADPEVMVTLEGTDSTWVYVNFSVAGGGSLYEDRDGNGRPDTTPRSTLQTYSNGSRVASVKLQMRSGTNKVTASIKDATDKTHVITYFYQSVRLSKVSGDGQVGRPTTQLADPLVVEVADSRGIGISGQAVAFSADTETLLVGIKGYQRVGDTGRTYLTDSNGQAKINYVLSGTAGEQTVTAGFDVDNDGTADDRSVSFTVTGDPNAVDVDAPPPRRPPVAGASLTVSAPSTATAGQTITVTATTSDGSSEGVIAFSSSRGGTFNPVNGPPRNGSLTTQFTLPTTPGNVTITASSGNYTADTAVVQVLQPARTFEVVTLLAAREGNPGQSLPIVIRTVPAAADVDIELSGTGFQTATGRTGADGSATISIVLPNTPGSYSLYATATGYNRRLVRVTVSGTATSTHVPVQLAILNSTERVQTVTIGSSATLRVRVTRTDTGVVQPGVEVTFRNSSGNDLPSGTVNTGNDGVATYTLAVTTSARRLIFPVITDTDVDDQTGTPGPFFEITGTARQPTQSTRLTIFHPLDSQGQALTSGGPGALHRLIIQLTNADGTLAVNQVVTLTVTNTAPPQVPVSSTTVTTNYLGTAAADTFRLPTTPGQYTITAVSGTQTRSITVTVVAVRLVKDTNDSISGDNQEGDRGEVLDDPFVVKVVQAVTTTETPVQGVPVTFTVVDGDGELSTSSNATSGDRSLTVHSEPNGEVRAYLVLDEDDEDNRVSASVGITGVSDVFFDATGEVVPYAIDIVSGNNQQVAPNRYTDPMVVRVTDEDGRDLQGATVTFSLRGGSGTLTPRSAETDRNGEAEAELLPRDAGTYFVTASVQGVPSVRFTITVGELADSIEIVSGNNQSGEPGTELEDPFVVEVLDSDDDVVSGVTVTFSITAGGGSLSATSVTTNARGRAQTTLTLGDDPGRNTVRASVSGVSDRVTFTATAGPTEPDVRLPAAQRADSYWINTERGTLHRLVGSRVENIAPSVRNVVSLAVTSNRLYWVEKTANNRGKIQRSNLNGSNVQLIRDLTAAPAGIAVDTTHSKIYLTNGYGKVQSINFNGAEYKPNLITNQNNPKDIAVGAGKVYWITGDNTVHAANVDGTGVTRIATGYRYNTLQSIAVGGGKVFWTEETSDSTGHIHSANLNGSNVQELASLLAAPVGISVDTAANKLYFTNSRGRLMQSDLRGGSIEIVVADLGALGDLSVLSGTTSTRPPGTYSQYDVNRDGTVDNTDAALVADALGESPPSNPRLDVNGDGRVNFLDLLLVFDNRDATNAAPSVAVAKLPQVSRAEVQHQINLLLASDNHSVAAQHTLAYLQRLLAVVTPEKTRLLANYPNPFNPETWIPYQLATESDVQITIYDAAGNRVRTLTLGYQAQGYYTDRSRAAYWDGRNAIGEPVASGVYFYMLTTDTFAATRKMLILK